jgi:hypothetical protein
MATNTSPPLEISSSLIEAIRSFPLERQMLHCGVEFTVSPFDIYAVCPRCGTKIKLRAFSACPDLADVFDAVMEWLNQPGAEAAFHRRQQEILADED